MKELKLTPKQIIFANEYLVDFNAAQAYIRAGYSKNGARVSACKLLTNPNIQAFLQKQVTARSDRLEITADMVLQERARLAFFNVKDLYNLDGTLKNINELDVDLAAAIHGIKIGAKLAKKADGSEVMENYIKDVKMMDKDKSLTALEKHLGIYEKDNEQKGNADLKTKQEFMEALLQSISQSDRGLPKE
ncbi:MAG: terminase small subunit [Proteobacteria bacterium]|nr:terminase small subunit [Desulfobacula sp.]MBU3951546.1 terminase small subunit [Pseudomonadota bacterium]MBU4131532.1 terminase small subunit [Pseudomonadota bacterium]